MSTENRATFVRVLYSGGRITIEIDGLPLFDGRRGLVVDTRNEFPETTVEQAWLLAKNLVDDLRHAPPAEAESWLTGDTA